MLPAFWAHCGWSMLSKDCTICQFNFVHLFPTKLGFPNDVVETLRPYYYKILRFLVRPTTEKNQGVIAEKSLEIRPSKYSDAESKMMKLLEDASDAERENSETTLEKVDERLRRFNPGEYSQQELMAMMKKKQKLKESFADHARKPYWVGGDQLFNRTVQHREINTTLARGTDVATQTYSFSKWVNFVGRASYVDLFRL
ncbi:uncharacterized protein LOC132903777 [Amyelois transitella]|uniref:uncharacterized protein LOC132903777 n=1 Tax=Amyelois transitella TaxID=680683 RepID=UPI00298F473F|nr:uncharacterized protein LOC132903777 [Amyelois transitella]